MFPVLCLFQLKIFTPNHFSRQYIATTQNYLTEFFRKFWSWRSHLFYHADIMLPSDTLQQLRIIFREFFLYFFGNFWSWCSHADIMLPSDTLQRLRIIFREIWSSIKFQARSCSHLSEVMGKFERRSVKSQKSNATLDSGSTIENKFDTFSNIKTMKYAINF